MSSASGESSAPSRAGENNADIRLVAEVELGLDNRQRLHQRRPPALDLPAQRAARHPQRLSPLRLGLRVDEIGKRFRLREIELAIGEAAAREFAGFGRPQAREPMQSGERALDDRAAAMELQLGVILAR